METQVTTNSTNPNLPAQANGWAGVYDGVDKSDLMMPTILLGQGLSPFVSDGRAKAGDIVKSQPFKIIGDKDKPVAFIPLMISKSWRIFESDGSRWVFDHSEPYHEKDKNLHYLFDKDGTSFKREKTIHAYVLLTADIETAKTSMAAFKEKGEMPSPDTALIPASIMFRSMSYTAGRKLAMHFKMAESFNVPPASTTLLLKAKFEKNDRGQFYVWDIDGGVKTTPENIEIARQWYNSLYSKPENYTVDAGVEESHHDNAEKIPF